MMVSGFGCRGSGFRLCVQVQGFAFRVECLGFRGAEIWDWNFGVAVNRETRSCGFCTPRTYCQVSGLSFGVSSLCFWGGVVMIWG